MAKKNRHINLFKDKAKKQPSDIKVFDMMEAVADKTVVDFSFQEEQRVKKEIESILDTEFEKRDYGEKSAWFPTGKFMGMKVPRGVSGVVDALVLLAAGNVQNVLKSTVKEEMVTLYRGVDKWHPGKMVQDRKFVGAGAHGFGHVNSEKYRHLNRKTIWTSRVKDYVEQPRYVGQGPGRITLEFEVPKSYVNKFAKETGRGFSGLDDAMETFFEEGLPVEFLKKVHK